MCYQCSCNCIFALSYLAPDGPCDHKFWHPAPGIEELNLILAFCQVPLPQICFNGPTCKRSQFLGGKHFHCKRPSVGVFRSICDISNKSTGKSTLQINFTSIAVFSKETVDNFSARNHFLWSTSLEGPLKLLLLRGCLGRKHSIDADISTFPTAS